MVDAPAVLQHRLDSRHLLLIRNGVRRRDARACRTRRPGQIKLAVFVCYSIVYFILIWNLPAAWIWNPTGWLARKGMVDFAGGLVVHGAAGAAGLAIVDPDHVAAVRALRELGGAHYVSPHPTTSAVLDGRVTCSCAEGSLDRDGCNTRCRSAPLGSRLRRWRRRSARGRSRGCWSAQPYEHMRSVRACAREGRCQAALSSSAQGYRLWRTLKRAGLAAAVLS
jgi:Ammonium Transporter Family